MEDSRSPPGPGPDAALTQIAILPQAENMSDRNFDTTYYRYCRDITGKLVPVDLGRQNGRCAPRFDREITAPEARPLVSRDFRELVVEVTRGLTRIQRRTWLKIIFNGLSIAQIALDEKVTRTAIYQRIHQMVRKNGYVAIWWRRRETQRSL